MKTKFFVLATVLIGLAFASPVKAEKEKRDVPSFSKIALHISGTIYLKQGAVQSVEIDAKPETLQKIETEVSDNKLAIKFPNSNYFWNSFDPGKILIYITVPDIDALSISGSGDIISEGAVKTGNLELAVSGSGDISFTQLQASNVNTSISGSGDVRIENGESGGHFQVSISGSGNVKASGFKAKSAEIKVSGSGNTSVYAAENLKVKVSGSGDVFYKGSPEIDSAVSGSGSLKKISQ